MDRQLMTPLMLDLRKHAWVNLKVLFVKDVLNNLRGCKFISEAKLAPNVKSFIMKMI